MLVGVNENVAVVDPLITPLEAEAGNVTVPLKANVCEAILKVPLVCVYAPLTVNGVPSVKVEDPFKVRLLSVCEPTVINKLLVLLEVPTIKFEVEEPVVEPFAAEEAKVAVPLKVKVFPFKLTIPRVCV